MIQVGIPFLQRVHVEVNLLLETGIGIPLNESVQPEHSIGQAKHTISRLFDQLCRGFPSRQQI